MHTIVHKEKEKVKHTTNTGHIQINTNEHAYKDKKIHQKDTHTKLNSHLIIPIVKNK